MARQAASFSGFDGTIIMTTKLKWESIRSIQRLKQRELGAITKDWGGKVAIALAYPNRYEVGMSSLGFQTVYAGFNDVPEIVCERVFYGAPGLSPEETAAVSWESQRPLDEFTAIAFSLSFEMDYLNALHMLRVLGIPLSAAQRDDSSPLLIAGGPAVTANPLPLSSILDAIVLGEAEQVIPRLAEALIETTSEGRDAVLQALADLPGVYVPALHGPSAGSHSSHPVQRQWVTDLDEHPTHSIVLSPDAEFGSMYLIEIARGCRRRCPFCLAGHTYQPHRERSLESILAQVRDGLNYRERIGLVAAAVSDYSRIDELAVGAREMGARLSVSSLRVRPLPESLLRALSESGEQTLTIAPEAGSQRLRDVIQKGVREADLFRAAEMAQKYGLRQLKLYFMIGLPTETEEEVADIARLAGSLGGHFARQITVNVTSFVPKAHTPFEREAMLPEAVLARRLSLLRGQLRAQGIQVRADSPKEAIAQGILARGDRAVSLALEALLEPTVKDFQRALAAAGLRAEDYLAPRSTPDALPWQFVRQ